MSDNSTKLFYIAVPVTILIIAMVSCNKEPAAPVKPKVSRLHEVQGEFRSRSYPVSEHEHVVIYDVPDRWNPLRCWAFVNEKTNTSNMHCDDEGNSELPVIGQELEK